MLESHKRTLLKHGLVSTTYVDVDVEVLDSGRDHLHLLTVKLR